MNTTTHTTTYELKNVKVCQWASEETYCYEASLYENGKRIAHVYNDGRGGEDMIDISHEDAQRVADTIREWNVNIQRQNAEEYGWDFNEDSARKFSRLDSLTSYLLDEHLLVKDAKALYRKTAKRYANITPETVTLYTNSESVVIVPNNSAQAATYADDSSWRIVPDSAIVSV